MHSQPVENWCHFLAKIALLMCLLTQYIFLEAAEAGTGTGIGIEDNNQTSSPSVNQSEQKQLHKFVSGVYSEQLPSPIFYDTYIPIVFQYELPEWNKSEVTFNNWYHCESETLPYKSCAVMYHLNKAIANLHIDFESLQPVQDVASHGQHYETLYQDSSFCDNIQRHFSGIFIQKPELANYIGILKRCQSERGTDGLQNIEKVTDFNYQIAMPYNRIEMNFYESFYKPINASSEITATAVLANSRSNIQATLLGTYYAEKYRWVHALQDCQQGLLPHSLISVKKLTDTLIQLMNKPQFDSNYEFTISLDLMSKYYSLPLTDCTYTNDSFVVRLLFPVKLKTSTTTTTISNSHNNSVQLVQLLRLISVPFRYNDQLCSVKLPFTKVLFNAQRQIAYSSNGDGDSRHNCQSNSLCQMPNAKDSNPCAIALLTGDKVQVQAKCTFECMTHSYDDKLLVTRVASEKYVITGGEAGARPNTNGSMLIVNCAGKAQPLVMHLTGEQVETGANELTLPCGCQFTVVSTGARYYSGYPCKNASLDDLIQVVRLEPWHLVRLQQNSTNNDLDEVDRRLVAHYTEKSDDDESEENAPVEVDAPPIQQSSHEHEHEHPEHSLELIWVTFLPIAMLLIILQAYVLYKLHRISKSLFYNTQIDGPPTGTTNTLETNTRIDNLLYYKVTGSRNGNTDADLEPEVHLIRSS